MMPKSACILSAADMRHQEFIEWRRQMFPYATAGERKTIIEAMRVAWWEITTPLRFLYGPGTQIEMTPARQARIFNRMTALLGYTEDNPEARHGKA